jgi:stalled ribosome alternative rescue factor ArfA
VGFSPEEAFIAEAGKQVEVKKPEKEEPATEPVSSQKPTIIKQEPAKSPADRAPLASDAIIYRVQFASNAKPKGSYEITSDREKYKTFEYFYNGAYRSCAGDFTTPGLATNLQNQLKHEGYPDAFVVAFRNNERLTGSIQSIAKLQKQAGQKPLTEKAQTKKPVEIKQEPAKPPAEEASIARDAVIYRVQFSSNSKPRGSYEITAGGKTYKTYEYLHSGAYRSCAGEFSNLPSAVGLQNVLKREGFPDAFVVAFKNDVRLTDPALFRK